MVLTAVLSQRFHLSKHYLRKVARRVSKPEGLRTTEIHLSAGFHEVLVVLSPRDGVDTVGIMDLEQAYCYCGNHEGL